MAVNVFALAVLVAGLLYVGQYRQGLIDTQISALTIQAQMFAAALGEAAVGAEGSVNQYLKRDTAGQIVRRLAQTTHTQARLITADGKVLSDSRQLRGPGAVQVEELPPPEEPGSLMRRMLDIYDSILDRLLHDDGSENIPTIADAARKAIAGETSVFVGAKRGDDVTVSVAVPVQRYKRVLGALILIKDTRQIDEAVFQVRLDILKIFGVALLITIGLSIYLAGTIARPIRRLAEAADYVRHGMSRQHKMPDFSNRKDEIGELGDALTEMTEALWQRMDAIESFAADVAHEIKNPLTSLRSAVETVARIEDAEQQRKLMSIIQDDIQRLDRLISDISAASRLDSELSRAELSLVDIGGMLSTLVDLYDAGDTRLIYDPPRGAPMIVAGLEDRLVQVLRNLIGNGVSFSPVGGIITLSADRDDHLVKIMVEDEGPGVPPGSEENIFERFYQDRPSTEKFGTHSGLGLSISKQIIDAIGGRIWAENRVSEDGRILGARFIVCLPEAE